MAIRFKPPFSSLYSNADSFKLNISVSTQILTGNKILPGTFMRGRVVDNSFNILDKWVLFKQTSPVP